MPVLFGLWLIAVGLVALWYRREIYLLLQSVKEYPTAAWSTFS